MFLSLTGSTVAVGPGVRLEVALIDHCGAFGGGFEVESVDITRFLAGNRPVPPSVFFCLLSRVLTNLFNSSKFYQVLPHSIHHHG